ncbi:sigma54 specific transcriptional regulator, Fis family [Anaeromyxobacter dehalogenans 2CP-1]|uniref:Sigma54 specific transcriptional regulator, Fis family n=1 Tax=Anaeromyxobacter dehalogenans (strain ATCC BAA-258 / DSM 21875 / 2CP-1) TaxID=455488 RepID=B8JA05_ANAD2|nr:sigma-54-dependent Fis family transcriptional regulator [Anaeromyxobacter dehalogenans]ACL63708.1 sigma54 specific transcriptional regulator, Fis family [Anaeromyxobacter dehalogenans 2CP-1]
MRIEDLDLREILSFDPRGGVIRFMGQRVVLFDAVALGLLRKELTNAFGTFAARGVLTRFGYAHGWRVGEALEHEHPDLWKEGKAGPFLPPLKGQFILGENVRTDGLGDAPLVETVWHRSYEAEQHLLHIGLSDEPVCWTSAAFASGYLSYKERREVYVIEDRCVGKGDSECHIAARFKERWGPELERHLPYYHMESIDHALQEVSSKLRRTERRLRERQAELERLATCSDQDTGLVARSEAMRRVLERARSVARTGSSVVVTGESGVGKEEVARLVHRSSERAGGPFVAVNCGAIPETLLERELFGHVKGAFTGAETDAVGLFEAADGGTLFLDEVGEVSPAMQVKLLRALQEREVRPVGDSRSRKVDVRIVAATNRDLAVEVASGRFRQDLFYRLNVIELRVPPLRDRPDDVVPLARCFLAKLSRSAHRPVTGFTAQVADLLVRYPWPGNVRELQNAVEYAVALSAGNQVGVDDLPEALRHAPPAPARPGVIRPLHEVEREHVLAALRTAGGNKVATAAGLHIGLATLYRKLKEYGEPAP